VVGFVSGIGELFGYGLRLVSGRMSERTGELWPITLFGYSIQMLSVPLLAFAGSWQLAAVLIIIERIGKATRNRRGTRCSPTQRKKWARAGIWRA